MDWIPFAKPIQYRMFQEPIDEGWVIAWRNKPTGIEYLTISGQIIELTKGETCLEFVS